MLHLRERPCIAKKYRCKFATFARKLRRFCNSIFAPKVNKNQLLRILITFALNILEYASEMIKWVLKIGTSTSAAGARPPISETVKWYLFHVMREI